MPCLRVPYVRTFPLAPVEEARVESRGDELHQEVDGGDAPEAPLLAEHGLGLHGPRDALAQGRCGPVVRGVHLDGLVAGVPRHDVRQGRLPRPRGAAEQDHLGLGPRIPAQGLARQASLRGHGRASGRGLVPLGGRYVG